MGELLSKIKSYLFDSKIKEGDIVYYRCDKGIDSGYYNVDKVHTLICEISSRLVKNKIVDITEVKKVGAK